MMMVRNEGEKPNGIILTLWVLRRTQQRPAGQPYSCELFAHK